MGYARHPGAPAVRPSPLGPAGAQRPVPPRGPQPGGAGLVPVRRVFVRDREGTHRDEYFFTTDPTRRPEQIVSWYTQRWSIETTYQELRAHLGLETTRQRV